MHERRFAALALTILMSCSGLARAGSFVNHSDAGVAIHAYDPVAYFDEGEPLAGKPEFTADWGGATWQFASAEHRDRFQAMPEKYAPQFGGYCAYGVANHTDVNGDPELWRIVDGKLYFNNNRIAQALWARDVPGHIKEGDANWPDVKAKVESGK